MSARFIVADVFDGLATLDDGSVDLIVTSPPFLALRSYLPADHPDKSKEIGSEATPAEFIDTLLAVTAELRRVLAPHGSICVELGDTYAGSGGAGGDYTAEGLRAGQELFTGSALRNAGADPLNRNNSSRGTGSGKGWPLAKSRALIPQLYEIALAYGINPLTGQPSPAGQWRIRNVVTWARPNPPVGALGDKWRPATSDVVVACLSGKRYWDDLATRKPYSENTHARMAQGVTERTDLPSRQRDGNWSTLPERDNPTNGAGAPLLDYWEIPPGGYKGSHYAVFPPALVEPLVKAMCPFRVCNGCGLALSSAYDSRALRGVRTARRESVGDEVLFSDLPQSAYGADTGDDQGFHNHPEGLQGSVPPESSDGSEGRLRDGASSGNGGVHRSQPGTVGDRSPQERGQGGQPHLELGTDDQDAARSTAETQSRTSPLSVVWEPDSDTPQCPACESRDLRPGRVFDCFAGSGTTLAVATGHGHDAIGIDLDARNADLAMERVGPFLMEIVDSPFPLL